VGGTGLLGTGAAAATAATAEAAALVRPASRDAHRRNQGRRRITGREPGLVGKWVRVLTQQDLGSFSLTDETGEAAVDGPFVDLETDESSWTTMPVWLFVTLKEQGVPFTEPFGDKEQFRYAETILSVGDRITAFGRATTEIDPAGRTVGLHELPTLPHVKGSETKPVIIADD